MMKIGFAGTGYINKIHAVAARNCGAELAAIVNHKPASMAAFAEQYRIPRQYETVDAMLKANVVDALVVSTPNYLHMPQTIAALRSGVHVLVEKPMAMDASEAERMCEASAKSGAQLMVAHCWRFDDESTWLKSHLAGIGRILRTKSYGVHVQWGPSGWFTQKKYAGGGAMADVGVHAIDTTRFLLGDPKPHSVYASIGTYYRDFDVDDTGVLMVNWDSGTTSYIESGWWQPRSDGPLAATQLYGRDGVASLYPTRVEKLTPSGDKMEMDDGGFVFPRKDNAPQAMYDAQMRYFIECITENKTPVPSGMEGLVNMKVIDAAYKSARVGGVVEL
jgi:predicted dehydrogenase